MPYETLYYIWKNLVWRNVPPLLGISFPLYRVGHNVQPRYDGEPFRWSLYILLGVEVWPFEIPSEWCEVESMHWIIFIQRIQRIYQFNDSTIRTSATEWHWLSPTFSNHNSILQCENGVQRRKREIWYLYRLLCSTYFLQMKSHRQIVFFDPSIPRVY